MYEIHQIRKAREYRERNMKILTVFFFMSFILCLWVILHWIKKALNFETADQLSYIPSYSKESRKHSNGHCPVYTHYLTMILSCMFSENDFLGNAPDDEQYPHNAHSSWYNKTQKCSSNREVASCKNLLCAKKKFSWAWLMKCAPRTEKFNVQKNII